MVKFKQRAKAHRTVASGTESALNTSAAPFPNLQRKQNPSRNREKKDQFARGIAQETNTAVSFDSEDSEKRQPILNIEERERKEQGIFLKCTENR